MQLEFDPAKEAANLAKHGVDFSTVLRVFEDPLFQTKTTAWTSRGSTLSATMEGILTVRFTIREDALRVIGAGYWRKQKSAYENQKT